MPRPPKGITISDVAARAGVSLATVSRVLNGNARVDAALAERVRDAAAELAYTASPLARSLVLGRTQTVAVVEAGGRTVSLGDLLGPEFAQSPHEMFSKDRFHPSAAGYARAAAALLPSVCAALGVWGADTSDRPPEPRRGEGVGPVAVAAGQAVKDPGTEVAPTEIAGQSRGPRGRWAVLLRRRPDDVPPAEDTPVEPTDAVDAPEAAGPA